MMTVDLEKKKILFLCTGNSCRSQMAEAWARELLGGEIEPYSAGVEPQRVDQRAVRIMREAGIDISQHTSKHVDSLCHIAFDAVITLCGHARETCPLFTGAARRFHRGFDDPSKMSADSEEKIMKNYRRVRDELEAFIKELPSLFEEPDDGFIIFNEDV